MAIFFGFLALEEGAAEWRAAAAAVAATVAAAADAVDGRREILM